jgi:Fe-S-cluster containining protein
MKDFTCKVGCWAPCCNCMDVIPEMKEYDAGNGRCKHLDENGKCMIYETRPDICNMDTMWQKYNPNLTWEFYCWLSNEACGHLLKYLAHKKPKEKK